MPTDSVKTCEKKFCKDYTKKIIDKSTKMKNKMIESVEMKPSEKKMIDTVFKSTIKTLTKEIPKKCSTAFCNPSCKGTVFQDGTKFPEELKEKILKEKDGNVILDMLIAMRKSLFKDKKSIIKNGFYKKLKQSDIKQLKKNGALSGCSIAIL